ncbi:MSMEG_1061 family FMN-dependent PPOX-type flavoprotein [Candidatus Njordibacter sp. Uisw_039]|jgi:PPOX class probable FMN-dependent enzyme|uniref:MSMEG_1061 family FMN-dependent PPOX-type flavoprotein n=1 Tax=Candidatus Njordibacter sp. Uisw_039 TaxID=3230972 RepID=UPI003AFD4AEF
MYIESEKQLREIYGIPKGRAKDKQLPSLEQHSINFIAHSPFVTISSRSKTGLVDCSPRGGKPGFVKVLSENCIIFPDGKGNNRLDSLVNIVETGDLGCLFLIPGVDETLRVNGMARISTSAEYLNLFSNYPNPPKTCIELTIKEVFLHCAKALMRSELWASSSKVDRAAFPTIGKMMNDQLSVNDTPEAQADMVARYQRDL